MADDVMFFFQSVDAEAALARLREAVDLKPSDSRGKWEAPGLPGWFYAVGQERKGSKVSVLGPGFGPDWIDGSLSRGKERPHYADNWVAWWTGERWNACAEEPEQASPLLSQARRVCEVLGLESFVCLPDSCPLEELPEDEVPSVTFPVATASAAEVFRG